MMGVNSCNLLDIERPIHVVCDAPQIIRLALFNQISQATH
jgi:hypothetical protein